MCGKGFLENGPTLMSVIKYVIKQLIITYPHALEFVLECYKTQKMCDKAIGTYPYTIQSVPESYQTQEVRRSQFTLFDEDSVVTFYRNKMEL